MAVKPPAYDPASMVFHWAIATLVFSVGMTSPWLDRIARPSLSTFHNVGGTVALLAALGWYVWQMRRPRLADMAELGTTERAMMHWAVMIMNVTLVAAPISGIVLLFAHGGSLGIDGYRLGYPISTSELGLQRLGLLHHVLGAVLVVTAGGHALHAVWHHVVRADRLLARMLPGHEK